MMIIVRGKTHPVGQKLPNAWGLYDVYGNICEWCQDWYHDSYEEAPTDGIAWESPEGKYRVVRGGGWNKNSQNCRTANRNRNTPDNRNNNLGVRLL